MSTRINELHAEIERMHRESMDTLNNMSWKVAQAAAILEVLQAVEKAAIESKVLPYTVEAIVESRPHTLSQGPH